MLLTRISQPPTSSPTPEDIFSSALTTIFTDDTVNSHGTPGSYVTYRSPRFGDLKLYIPAHPEEEDGRKLFAHYLWNAAVVAADATESASQEIEDVRNNVKEEIRETDAEVTWNRRFWDLRGKTVLELGAGTALPSLIAALSGAKSCTITDHPSSPALTTRAIQNNVEANLHRPDRASPASRAERDDEEVTQTRQSLRMEGIVQVLGYTWGTSIFYLPDKYGKPACPSATPTSFDRIISADCLWMPSQHINLIKTILHFLPVEKSKASALRPSPSLGSRNEPGENHTHSHNSKRDAGVDIPDDEHKKDVPCALVVAGFHTGRRIVSDFFSLATESQPGLTIPNGGTTPCQTSSGAESSTDPATANTISLDPASLTPSERQACGLLGLASAFEVDVDGHTRAWQKERLGEGKWEAKRWCVVGVLVRR